MSETAPESTNYVNYLKGIPSQMLRLANLTRVIFRGCPPDGTYEQIAERLYPDDPFYAKSFCLHMTIAEIDNGLSGLANINLVLEGSDDEIVRWLRTQLPLGLNPLALPETQQEKLQREMEEGNVESEELPQRQQSGSSEASVTDSVHWQTDTGHIGAPNEMGSQRRQESALRRRHYTSLGLAS